MVGIEWGNLEQNEPECSQIQWRVSLCKDPPVYSRQAEHVRILFEVPVSMSFQNLRQSD